MVEPVQPKPERAPAAGSPPTDNPSAAGPKPAGKEAGASLKLHPREQVGKESPESPSDAVAELWARVADVDPISYYWEEPPEIRVPLNGDAPEEASSPLFPVRRSLYKRSEPPPSPDEELANIISFLQRLQHTVRRAATQSGAPAPADAGQSLLQAKRLSRTGVTPDHFQVGALPKTWSPPPPEASSKPDPQTPADSPEAAPAPLTYTPPHPPAASLNPLLRPKRWRVVPLLLVGGIVLAALGLAAYGWTRFGGLPRAGATPKIPAAHAQPTPPSREEPTEEALNAANLALEAMGRGELDKASDLLAEIRKQGMWVRGLSYQAALLAFSRGHPEDAENFLDQSIAANEAVPDCWYLRANADFATGGPSKAAEDFEEATHAAPFSPRSYFFRAECLRRNGNAAAAISQFQQALRCRPNSADTELILFKIGMTKLEMNTDLIFKTELHDRLSQEPVAGDTLLLAAADALSRNEYAEAADDLRRAAGVLPFRTFQSRVRDYVFRSQAAQPDIAAALKPGAAGSAPAGPTAHPGARVPVDPATRSLAEADPAGW